MTGGPAPRRGTTRRLAGLTLLAALGLQSAAPLAAAPWWVAERLEHRAASASHDHHPGCPWRDRSMPCPHGEAHQGPSFEACSDGFLTHPASGLAPAILSSPAACGWPDLVARPFPGPLPPSPPAPVLGADPPPPRTASRL